MKRVLLGIAVAGVALVTSPQLGQSKPSKVTICHIPPGNADNVNEIDVDASAVYAHVFSPGHSGVLHSGPHAGTTVHDYIIGNTDSGTGGCNSPGNVHHVSSGAQHFGQIPSGDAQVCACDLP